MKALFPDPPRTLRGDRAWRVGARTVHLAAMGLLLGGAAYRVPVRDLTVPIVLTVASGLVLLGIDLFKSCVVLYQGCGVATLIKLALLGLGELFPSARIEWYLAATAVASIGSHMPGSWRHYSLVDRKVLTVSNGN